MLLFIPEYSDKAAGIAKGHEHSKITLIACSSRRGISLISRRFTLLLGLLLALPWTSPSLLATPLGEDVPLQLEEAWQKNPQDLQLGLSLLQHYLKHQDNSRVLVLAEQLYATYPNNSQVLKALIVSLLANGDANTALEHANKLTELQFSSPDAWYLLGLAYSQKSDSAPAAQKALDRALALQADNLPALELKTRLYFREQQYQEALESARSLQTRFPALPLGYRIEGDIQTQQRDFAKAVPAFQAAFNKAPSLALALALANAQWRADNPTEALKTLKSWLATNPKDIDARTQLLMYLNLLQRNTEAIAEGETILRQEPNNGIAVNNLAALYQQVGDKRALEFAERAIQLVPDSPDVADTLGWILVQSKQQLPRGIELLRQAVAKKADPQIRYHLAAAYAKAGQREEALRELDKLQQLNKLSSNKLPAQLVGDMQKLQTSLQQK